MHLALPPSLEGMSGLYANAMDEARPNPQPYDLDARRKLRLRSLALTGLAPEQRT